MLFGKKERRITRVLVVEDEPLVAFDTEHFLAGEGFEIVGIFDTVTDALSVIETVGDIHLVLVDVSLSDGSGVDVARAARDRGIRVMFVTANCPGQARTLAVGCLSKPYAQRDLLAAIAAIETMLDGKTPKRLPASFSLFAETAGPRETPSPVRPGRRLGTDDELAPTGEPRAKASPVARTVDRADLIREDRDSR